MSDTSEKVLIGSLQKFSTEDGPGIRTTIFFKGCPLNCKWCHNPELLNVNQELIQSPNNCIHCGFCIEVCKKDAISMDQDKRIVIDREKCDQCFDCVDECYANALRRVAKKMSVEDVLEIAEQDVDFYKKTGGGITLSGGEILMHGPFISKLIDEARYRDIQVCLDTSGYGNPDLLKAWALKENVQKVLYDLKSVDNEIHKEYMGSGNKIILKNLRMLAEDSRTLGKIIIRMPLIRGVNDSKELMDETANLLRDLGIQEVHLLPYHNLGISKKRNLGSSQEEFESPTEEETLQIKEYFERELKIKVRIF